LVEFFLIKIFNYFAYFGFRLLFGLNPVIDIGTFLVGALAIGAGWVSISGFMLLVNSCAFGKPNVWNIYELADGSLDMAANPTNIYPEFSQWLFW
jgi:ABC-type uncharacterized transport system permease subunit